MALLFALITETPLVTESDLYVLARALEKNGQHCAADWGLEAPALDVFHARKALPAFCCPIVFLDDDTDPGTLAVHYLGDHHLPAARVQVGRASGLATGEESVSEAAGHEVVEALVDPRCDMWTDCPGRPGVDIAYEVGDPVQNAYDIDGVKASNYVLHHYFDSRLANPEARRAFLDSGGKFDRLGTLKSPGSIGGEGYAILRDKTRTWQEDIGGELGSRPKLGAMHPWSRSVRRGAP